MRSSLRLVSAITGVLSAALGFAADPPSQPIDHSRLLVYATPDGQERPVRTPADWAIRRRQILQGMEAAMGPLPGRSKLPPPKVEILERVDGDGFVRLGIAYLAEENDRVPAHLYLPKDSGPVTRRPAIVAMHPTSALGKKRIAGEAQDIESLHRAYAKELAQRGYIVLAPDYPSFGDYKYDFKKSAFVSGTMKGVFNHIRGVDLLVAREDVDPALIGAIGHSLGGHNAIFLGAFDPRVQVVVSSCGWTPFHDYYGGKLAGWTSDRYMPRIRDTYRLDPDRMPFDFYEVIAALAPRAFFSCSPLGDSNFDFRGVKKAETKVREVFSLLGVADRLEIHYPDCTHDFPDEIRQKAYAFIDRTLRHTPRLCPAEPTVSETTSPLRVATFRCDVTPPMGQPMISGDGVKMVESPLEAKGIILEAQGRRYVLCAFDWCELCNGSHLAVRRTIAQAAGADVSHVAAQTVHQHTAPIVDADALKVLTQHDTAQIHLNEAALDEIDRRLSATVREASRKLEPFDSLGVGQAKVDRVASSRRATDPAGKIHVRWSTCKEPAVRDLPEGTIDPFLKTITLARNGKAIVRLHYYATHPQTPYGDGRASSDIVGDAREELQRKEGVFQIYFTGCGGDITLGKYNDGSKAARKDLAARLLAGMEAAVAATRFTPVGPVCWRTCPLELPRRTDRGFSLDECLARVKDPKDLSRLYRGALRVAFHQRSGQPIELSSLQLGQVHILHLPGEPMIAFQLFAQRLKPDDFVAVAGYGDCGPGYLCPEEAFREGGYEPTDSNVKPESEPLVKKAIASLLGIE